MTSISQSPELDARLESKFRNLRQFQTNQPQVWAAANAAYLGSRIMIGTVARVLSLSKAGTHRFMLWQTVLDYQIESLFLILDGRLDEGLALLRMGAELSRDVARLAESEELIETWLNRTAGKVQKRAYRDAFQFQPTDAIESYVHKLYSLASEFGVHGHTVTSSALRPSGLSPDGNIVALEASDMEVYQVLEIWLAAFFPLQDLCSRGFRNVDGDLLAEASKSYEVIRVAFDEAFKVYRQSL